MSEARVWTADEIREMIRTDDRWACRALLAIYDKQTIEEQQSDETLRHNGEGFTGADAPFLTRLAKFYRERGFLTTKQMQCLRFSRSGKDRLGKYSKQLARIAKAKEEKATAELTVS